MGNLREKYFGMTDPQRNRMTVVVLLLIFGGFFSTFIYPRVQTYSTAKKNLANAHIAVTRLEDQIETLKDRGKNNLAVEAAQIELLRTNENEVLFSSDMPGFLASLKDVDEKVGGGDFQIIEGKAGPAFLKIGQADDIYQLQRLPVKVSFTADYSTASNYLFQLSAMKRLMTFDNIEIKSDKYTSNLKITVDLGIYFVEES
jgi:hypothetical protein